MTIATREELIEAMAGAIFDRFYGGSSSLGELAISVARDHAEAALSAIASLGITLCPEEPTEKMIQAAQPVVRLGPMDIAHVADRWYGQQGWTMHKQEDGQCLQGRETGPARMYVAMLSASPFKPKDTEDGS